MKDSDSLSQLFLIIFVKRAHKCCNCLFNVEQYTSLVRPMHFRLNNVTVILKLFLGLLIYACRNVRILYRKQTRVFQHSVFIFVYFEKSWMDSLMFLYHYVYREA